MDIQTKRLEQVPHLLVEGKADVEGVLVVGDDFDLAVVGEYGDEERGRDRARERGSVDGVEELADHRVNVVDEVGHLAFGRTVVVGVVVEAHEVHSEYVGQAVGAEAIQNSFEDVTVVLGAVHPKQVPPFGEAGEVGERGLEPFLRAAGVHIPGDDTGFALRGHFFVKRLLQQPVGSEAIHKNADGVIDGEGVPHVEGKVAGEAVIVRAEPVKELVAGDVVVFGVMSGKETGLGTEGDGGGRGHGVHDQAVTQIGSAEQPREVGDGPRFKRSAEHVRAEAVNVEEE